jgi:hypothetical protein
MVPQEADETQADPLLVYHRSWVSMLTHHNGAHHSNPTHVTHNVCFITVARLIHLMSYIPTLVSTTPLPPSHVTFCDDTGDVTDIYDELTSCSYDHFESMACVNAGI